MDFTTDTLEYSVAQFHEAFNHRLPAMAKVQQGYYGECPENTFDKDQVIRINKEFRQKRVVVRVKHDITRKFYSIPLSYQAKFCVVNKKGKEKVGKEMDLQEIARCKKFPVTVKLAGSEELAMVQRLITTTTNVPAIKLKLLNVIEEIYLLGNVVNNDVITLPVSYLPITLPQLRLTEILGAIGQSISEFKEFLESLSDMATSVKYDQEFGNKEITEYTQTINADVVRTIATSTFYTEVDGFDEHKQQKGDRRERNKSERCTSDSCDTLPAMMIRNPKKYGTWSSRIAPSGDYTLIDLHDHNLPITERTVSPGTRAESNEYAEIPHQVDQVQGGVKKRLLQEIKDRKLKLKPLAETKGTEGPRLYPYVNDKSKYGNMKPPQIPRLPRIPRPPIIRVYKPEDIRLNTPGTNQPSPQLSEKYTLSCDSREQSIACDETDASEQPETLPRNSEVYISMTSPKAYADNGELADNEYPSPPSKQQQQQQQQHQQPLKASDISRLRIEEVCVWLCYLNLGKYCQKFREHMIDGKLLISLDERILRTDFGFSTVETLRLLMFAKEGHVPM